MSSQQSNHKQVNLEDIAFVGLAAANAYSGGLGGWVEKFVNHRVMYHGTANKNVMEILTDGFRQSDGGMLGKGVYAAHNIGKAEWFSKNRGMGKGTILKVEFDSANIKTTNMTDVAGSWRRDYDAVYSTASKRPECCINSDRIVISRAKATGSLSEQARAKIDQFFICNPTMKSFTVWLGIAAEIYTAAHQGAALGAMSAGHFMNAMADKRSKMGPAELEQLILEGVKLGTASGFAAGMAMTGVAASLTVEVPAAGLAGWFGATSTVAAFSSGGLALVGSAVALPVAFGVGAAYVISKMKQ